MADDIAVDTITGSPVVATDDDGTRHWPIAKLAFGDTDTHTRVSAADPLPVATPADPFGANADAASTAGGAGSVQAKLRLMTTQLNAIQTAVQLIDNAIAGNEMQVDIVTGPAADRTTDNLGVALDTDSLMQDTTVRAVDHVIINASTSGDNQLLAAQTGLKIRVVSLFLVSAGTVSVRFESGADGTALTGQMPLVANTGFVLPFNPTGWFETAADVLLNLELSAAVGVHGSFSYVAVAA